MAVCYILRSNKLNRFYAGATDKVLEEHLYKHDNKLYPGEHFTTKADDWELFLVIECINFKQALDIEAHIKSMKSSTYIHNLKKYSEMVEKLILKLS